jgi:hypothetical protein
MLWPEGISTWCGAANGAASAAKAAAKSAGNMIADRRRISLPVAMMLNESAPLPQG